MWAKKWQKFWVGPPKFGPEPSEAYTGVCTRYFVFWQVTLVYSNPTSLYIGSKWHPNLSMGHKRVELDWYISHPPVSHYVKHSQFLQLSHLLRQFQQLVLTQWQYMQSPTLTNLGGSNRENSHQYMYTGMSCQVMQKSVNRHWWMLQAGTRVPESVASDSSGMHYVVHIYTVVSH